MPVNPAKPKIFILENSLGVTGAFKSVFNATASISDSFEFIFAIDQRSKLKEWLEAKNQKYYPFNFIEIQKSAKLLLYLPQLFGNALKLWQLFKKEQASILHVNDLYNMLGVCMKMMHPQVKLVYHIRLLPDSYVGKLYYHWLKLISKYADRIICVSNAVYDALPDKSKAVVIYDSFYDTEKLPAKQVEKGNETKLLYLGNVIKGKGQDLALDAFIAAFRQNPNLRLKFIGGDLGQERNREFKRQLQEKVTAENLTNVVSFADFSNNIEQEIKSADIVLNFSESESFSMVCLEALYFGTPLIASDCGGPREIIEHKKSGLLVPNRDVPAMTEAILKLAADFELQKSFCQNGREQVRNKFSLQNTSFKLRSVYNEMLKN